MGLGGWGGGGWAATVSRGRPLARRVSRCLGAPLATRSGPSAQIWGRNNRAAASSACRYRRDSFKRSRLLVVVPSELDATQSGESSFKSKYSPRLAAPVRRQFCTSYFFIHTSSVLEMPSPLLFPCLLELQTSTSPLSPTRAVAVLVSPPKKATPMDFTSNPAHGALSRMASHPVSGALRNFDEGSKGGGGGGGGGSNLHSVTPSLLGTRRGGEARLPVCVGGGRVPGFSVRERFGSDALAAQRMLPPCGRAQKRIPRPNGAAHKRGFST